MSKSYDRNIERLKANQRSRSEQEQKITTAAAKDRGEYLVEHAKDITTKLTPFSQALQDWKDKDIKKKIEEGRVELEKAQVEQAKWLEKNGSEYQKKIIEIEKAQQAGELAYEFEDAKAQEFELQRLKAELLKNQGTDGYPDADRLAQLSPWQQVGYVQQDIKNKKAMMEDMLTQSMQNGEEDITLGGITFNAKEISQNKLAFQMKQHAVHYYGDKIFRNLGLHKYSKEMLERAKVTEHLRKVKDNQIAKHRKQYNIESSMNTQQKNRLQWQDSKKTGKDIQLFLITEGNTVDTNNNLLGNSAAWKKWDAMVVAEGIKTGNSDHPLKLLDVPMPDSMCKALGVPYGTKFTKQWPEKAAQLKKKIRKGIAEAIREEERILSSENIALGNEFDKLKQEGPIDEATLNKFKAESANRGGVLDTRIKNYETVSARNERVDKSRIKALIASNNGFITHEMLNEFHPAAALEYRKEATRHEEALKKKYNIDGQIKAALNESWADAGIKAKEKSVEWEYALANARIDYERKFNKLISIGYPVEDAASLALNAPLGSVKGKDGEPLPEFEGVNTEIQRNGALSKYTVQSQQQKESIKNSKIRISKIAEGKLEMQRNTLEGMEFNEYVIGGQYGQDRIQEIIESIKVHGTWNGIRKASHALSYYEGLSLGKRRLTGYALIDQQLKAAGHPGIWPDRKEEEDETGQVDAATTAYAPLNYGGSAPTANKVDLNEQSMVAFYSGEPDPHNLPENQAPWLA